jgi:predicted transposase/invertase (TIGR01784 family)
MKPRYVNPFTDFGFKKLFGEEASKPQLMDFLNAMLPEHAQIKDLSFRNAEQMGATDADRKAIYDIYCEGLSGERFIVELQKAKQNYFKDRTVFYSTFPIREQAEKGEWNYCLQPVYCIGVLDFTFDDGGDGEVVHHIKLKNQKDQVFYDKLTYIYLEMPNFNKTEAELATRLDKWLYFIRHLVDLQEIPRVFGGEAVFEGAFKKAEVVALNPAEQAGYETSLKIYRDLKGVIDSARDEGEQIGLEKGEQIGLEKGEQIGLEKGEQIGIEKAKQAMLARLIESGMTAEEARKLIGR